MTINVLPGLTYLFLLVFARVGAMAMTLPGIGERGISMRARLVFALVLALMMLPLLGNVADTVPDSLAGMIAGLVREILVGVGIGLSVRLLMGAIQTAATTIAFQMGLGFAQNLDPTQGVQGALMSSFMSVLALTLIMATNTHHMLIAAIYDSYTLFPPGANLPVGDFASMAVESVATAFRIASQIAAPFIVFGIIFYLGMGIIARLIPQIQVFFVAMPMNIMLGFVLFGLLLGTMMTWFLQFLQGGIAPFLTGG
ncbi:MAG: flagellar type III secretion system protein FliR [Rhodobiaceae bacterium]|nr:flagellar type III secretion system protein FliR [Rhodobiaceae bacterium]